MSKEFQFTRYLYEKSEVKLALTLCILNKKDEAVFWAYELYYSGFKTELTELFWTIYYDFYYTLNPSFEKYLITKLKNNLDFDTNCENLLAMIVNNFMIRPHSTDIFMLKQIVRVCDFDKDDSIDYTNLNNIKTELVGILKTRDYYMLASFVLTDVKNAHLINVFEGAIDCFSELGIKIDKKKTINEYKKIKHVCKRVLLLSRIIHYYVVLNSIKLGKNIYVHVEPEDVILYETITVNLDDTKIPAYKILPLAKLYYIDSYNYLSLFDLKRENSDIKKAYYYDWLYHASFSPLWRARILKHNGRIDEKIKKIIFEEDADSDDNEQSFYNEFGYEPDEHKIETQNKTIQEIKKDKTWLSFYNKHKNNGIIEIDTDILNDIHKINY